MVTLMEKLKIPRRERNLGNDSFKPLNFTDRSNIAYDTAVYTKANDDVVVFICGVTDESILYNGGGNKGGIDGFIMAVNASGELIWSSMLGGNGDDEANAVTLLQGGNDKNLAIFIAGTLAKPVSSAAVNSTTRPVPRVNTMVEFNERSEEVVQKYNRDAILYKFTENGTQSWNVTWGTDSDDYVSGIAVDEERGLVYVGGSTSGTFGSEAKASNHTKHFGDKYMFITSFEAKSGSIVWTRVFGSDGFDSVQRIATDQQGNIYVTSIMSSKPFVGCWDHESDRFSYSRVRTTENLNVVALAVGQSSQTTEMSSKTFVYISGYTNTEKQASFAAQFDAKTLHQNWMNLYKGEKITSNDSSSLDVMDQEEIEMEDGSDDNAGYSVSDIAATSTWENHISGSPILVLLGETQSTESNEGYGFLLMANSSGDWIDYRGLSGSESTISLAITNNHVGDVLSCITGSIPESAGSSGIPFLFIEVDTLEPPPLVLANSTIPDGSNSTISDGSNSNWLASPSSRMELGIIVIGIIFIVVFLVWVFARKVLLWPQNFDPVEDGGGEDSRLTGDEAGVDSSIWTQVSAPRYRRLNYPSLQSPTDKEIQCLSGIGDRGSVELTNQYPMGESYDPNSIRGSCSNNAN